MTQIWGKNESKYKNDNKMESVVKKTVHNNKKHYNRFFLGHYFYELYI